MSFNLNRINPNQTQIFFHDGRFETLTNEELEEYLLHTGLSDAAANMGQNVSE